MNIEKKMQKALNHLNKVDMRLNQLRLYTMDVQGKTAREWYVLQIQLRVLRAALVACARRRGVTLDMKGMPK